MTYSEKDHTFVVCAYKESPYLESCIQSLLSQTVKSKIILSTSTPNEHIQKMALKYNIPLYINSGKKSIADDWNFGSEQVKTSLYTIAHQDDVYNKEYLERILENINIAQNPIIVFTNYNELRNNKICCTNFLLKTKRRMLKPLEIKVFWKSRWIRRRILSIGNPICCPSVTYVKGKLPGEVFTFGFRSNVDWQAWEKLSRLSGSFVYVKQALMCHRIHSESETSKVIESDTRGQEDLEMFRKFWPYFIAKQLTRIYGNSEKSNKN